MNRYFTSTLHKYLSSYSGLSRVCWYGINLAFIDATLGGVCFFLSIYFVETLHIDIAIAGIIISFYGFGTAIGGFIGGKLSDRTSPATVSIISLLVQGMAFLSFLEFKSIKLITFNLFILGIAAYSFLTSNSLWVLKHCHAKEKLKAINLLTVASNLGIGISAIIVSILEEFGFQCYFLLGGVLFIFCSLYLFLLEKINILSLKFNSSNIETRIDDSTNKLEKKNVLVTRLILICLFIIGLIVAQLGTTYSVYIKKSFPQLGMKGISFLFVINSLLVICFQTPIVNMFSNNNKLVVAGIGGFLVGFGMLLLNFPFHFSFMVLACCVYTIGEMLFFSTAQLLCYESGLEKKKGESLGVFRSTYALSIVIGPTIGGYVYSYFGGSIVWYISGILGTLCLVVCYAYKANV